MALLFLPPTAPLRPYTGNRWVTHPAHSLFRHYRPMDAGINVWLLANGTLSTVDPADGSERRVFHGGHQHLVDEVEAALLRAAGYTVTEIPDTLVQPGLGVPDWSFEPTPPPPVGEDFYVDIYEDVY